MKPIYIAVCACALSACALTEEEGTPSTTTDIDRRVRPFETEMLLQMDNVCDVLTVYSHWTVAQPDQANVVYTVTDLTLGSSYTDVSPVDLYDIGDDDDIFAVLSPSMKGKHRFLLEASLLDSQGNVLLSDTFKTRFPCQR